ncbi:MAG: HTH-type transcriptional repressor CytR [Lentisphaerae bacterium ADurb.Bin242]|nr:MAG: HTH-type transcriptional repressor CytR [Lentisphaerae bacterium ADurb.Bin242]
MAEKYSYASIARELGVSKALVSSVLRNTSVTTGSSKKTKRQILELAWNNGLRLNSNIGIVIPREVAQNQILYYHGLVGVIEKCSAFGYNLTSMIVDEHSALPEPLRNHEVSALLFWNDLPEEFAHFAAGEKMPFVLLNPQGKHPECDAVSFSDYGTMFKLLRHLYENGYRKFHYLLENNEMSFNCKTSKAFRNFSKQYQIAASILSPEGNDREAILPQLEKLAEKSDGRTAFITFTRFYTIKILEMLSRAGKRIPDDAGVVGSHLLSEFYNPSLTTIEYPFYEMGAAGVEMLHEKWDARQYVLGREKIIEGRILKKDSTVSTNRRNEKHA